MQGKTNNDVLTLMDEFLKPIQQEKVAADEINEIKKTNGAEPVTPEADKGDGKNQGEFGKEKQEDIKEGAEGTISADSPAATNEAGGSDKPTDNQGTESLGSDQKVSQPSVTVKETSDPQDDNKVNDKGETGGHDKMTSGSVDKEAKKKRNAYLAQNINLLLQKQAEEKAAVQKQAAEEQPSEKDKLFLSAYNRGIEKRAEDEAELVAAGMSPEEAEATLDTVADANPAAVLPEEAGVAPELPPEVAAEAAVEGEPPVEEAAEGEAAAAAAAMPESPEELAAALDSAGVSAEDLKEAVDTVEELEKAGVTPDEIVAAVQEAAGEAPAPVDKVAAARQGVIQEHLGLLKANK